VNIDRDEDRGGADRPGTPDPPPADGDEVVEDLYDIRAALARLAGSENTTAADAHHLLAMGRHEVRRRRFVVAGLTAAASLAASAAAATVALDRSTAPLPLSKGDYVVASRLPATPSGHSLVGTSYSDPQVYVTRLQDHPGSVVTVTGDGFQPHETVRLSVQAKVIASVRAGATGMFASKIPPSPCNGSCVLVARGSSSGIQVTKLVVVRNWA